MCQNFVPILEGRHQPLMSNAFFVKLGGDPNHGFFATLVIVVAEIHLLDRVIGYIGGDLLFVLADTLKYHASVHRHCSLGG